VTPPTASQDVASSTAPRAWLPAARSNGTFEALVGWLLARLVVGLVCLLVLATSVRHRALLLDWDAQWYLRIAEEGYGPLPQEALRFFPLTPLLARWTSPLLLGRTDVSLLVWANACALLYAVLLWRLVCRDTGDRSLAGRCAVLVALVPSGFVMVMGYAEPLFGVLCVAAVSAVRARRWLTAVPFGVLAGLDRPVALLLTALLAVEAASWLRREGATVRRLATALAAVLSPVVGVSTYCAWTAARFGGFLLPFQEQSSEDLRGGVVSSPAHGLELSWRALVEGGPWTVWSQLLVLAGLVLLVPLIAQRQPPSYAVWAGVTLLAAVTSTSWGSLMRYTFSAFPFVIALADLARTRTRWIAVLASSTALMALFGAKAFAKAFVP
jgi:hypothetical protein